MFVNDEEIGAYKTHGTENEGQTDIPRQSSD